MPYPLDNQPFKDLRRNVLITPDKKLIYLSIPKCGCSTVKLFLRLLYGQERSEAISQLHTPISGPLLSIDDIGGTEALVNIIETPDIHIFSVLRNPLDRLISCYKNKFLDASVETRQVFVSQLEIGNKSSPIIASLGAGGDLLFSDFVDLVACQKPLYMNEHWRPVQNQLLGIHPDRLTLFDLASMSSALKYILQVTGKETIEDLDTFSYSPHSTNSEGVHERLSNETINKFLTVYARDMYLFMYEVRSSARKPEIQSV